MPWSVRIATVLLLALGVVLIVAGRVTVSVADLLVVGVPTWAVTTVRGFRTLRGDEPMRIRVTRSRRRAPRGWSTCSAPRAGVTTTAAITAAATAASSAATAASSAAVAAVAGATAAEAAAEAGAAEAALGLPSAA